MFEDVLIHSICIDSAQRNKFNKKHNVKIMVWVVTACNYTVEAILTGKTLKKFVRKSYFFSKKHGIQIFNIRRMLCGKTKFISYPRFAALFLENHRNCQLENVTNI